MRAGVRNVLVTGGSRGLGLAMARRLAACGYCVISTARNKGAALEAAMTEARGGPGALEFVACDLGDVRAIPGMVQAARRRFGPIYGLVNNAGVGFDGLLALMPDARIEELLRINVLAPLVLSKYVARAMMAEGTGRIINISSVVAFTGYSGLSAYAASKASLIGFTRSLAREVGRVGITVNAVAPGFVDTDMTRGMDAEQREQVARRSALRRLAGADDVANAVEFLLGEGARNITGTVITVDAGNTA